MRSSPDPELGWLAYYVLDGFEYSQTWTIRIFGLRGELIQLSLNTTVGRREHLERLVALARAEGPMPPARTLWERLDED
jgi:hypothetical protein